MKEIEVLLFFFIFLPDNLIINIHLNLINEFLNDFNIYEVLGYLKEIPKKYNNLNEYITHLKERLDKKKKKIIKDKNFSIYLVEKENNIEYFVFKLSGILKRKIKNLTFLEDFLYISHFLNKFITFSIELATKIINFFITNYLYYESTSELSSVSEYGTWNILKYNHLNVSFESLKKEEIFLLNENLIENIIKFFEEIDGKTNCIINYLKYIYNKCNNVDIQSQIKSKNYFEDLFIKLITILIINKKYSNILKIVDISINLFLDLENQNKDRDKKYFADLIAKLYLIKLWYFYKVNRANKFKEIDENIINNLFFKAKNFIENNIKSCPEKYYFLGEFWIIFLKYLRMSRSNEEYPNECIMILSELKKLNNYKILWCKFFIELFRYSTMINKIDENLKKDMIYALCILKDKKYLKLKITGLYYYIRYFMKNPACVKSYIKEYEQIKFELNNDYLVDKFNIKLEKIKRFISQNIKNNFIFRYSKNIMKIENSLIEKNYFKNKLVKYLLTNDISINIDTSRFSYNTMLDLSNFDFGCKLYSIMIQNYNSGDFILIEDGKLGYENKKYNDLFNSIVDKIKNNNKYIEILFLGFLSSEELFKKKLSKLEIPYIIYFNFKTSFLNNYSIFEKFLMELYINNFLLYFTKEILKENSVLKSFNMVKGKINNEMRHFIEVKYRIFNIKLRKNKIITENYLFNNFTKAFGEGAKLSKNENCKKTFNNTDFFNKGDYKDISTHMKTPFDTIKKLNNFIGRENELKYLKDSMIKNKKNICIFGNKKVGKTQLALEFAYNLYKNNYFKDGYYYFDFKEIKNEKNEICVIDLIMNKFKFDINDFYSNSIKKDMLIIFDNFDKIKKNNLIYPESLINSISENNINLIIISEITSTLEIKKNDFYFLELKKLSYKCVFWYLQLKLLFNYQIAVIFDNEEVIKCLLKLPFFNKNYTPQSLNDKEIQLKFLKEVLNIDIEKKKVN